VLNDIGVVIPAYQNQTVLSQALRSLARQKAQPSEVVVVDDGSATPLHLDFASQWFSRSTKLQLLRTQTNGGSAAARNLGVSATSSSVICFLDHDDLAHPRKLERQMLCLRQGAEVVVPLSQSFTQLSEGFNPVVFGEPYVLPISLMMKRTLFDRLGGMKEVFGGDDMQLLMSARLSGARITILDEVLTYRRVGRSNLSLKIDRRRAMLGAVKAAVYHSRNGRDVESSRET